MILDGITCNVYGKTVTKWSNEMRLTKDSSGKPKWYDFGIAYDNLTIEAVITSADGAGLEALVRTQNLEDAIEAAFSGGEWLYTYTGDFTIQKFESIGRVDKDLSEWGYKITLGTIDPINMSTLPGSRVECDGSGYITYSTTKIPQPKEYDFKYQTKKYTGLTHGSSYSAELPTNPYDKTAFPVVINSGNMRSLIDDITTHRGDAFGVTFPAGCYPFGIAAGNGNFICKASKRDYTITNVNGDWWSIDLGLYNAVISTAAAPVWTVQPADQTIASGATATFTGTVTGDPTPTVQWEKVPTYFGAPTFNVSEWTDETSNWTISASSVSNTVSGGSSWLLSDYKGAVAKTSFIVELDTWGTTAGNHIFYGGVISDGTDSNRIFVSWNETDPNRFRMLCVVGGVGTSLYMNSSTAVSGDITKLDVELTISVSGAVTCTGIGYNTSATPYTFSGTLAGGYNTGVDYYCRLFQFKNASTYTQARVEGVGFPNNGTPTNIIGATSIPLVVPNVGTTGDPFGTQYQAVATNTEGTATTNTVTTIEA